MWGKSSLWFGLGMLAASLWTGYQQEKRFQKLLDAQHQRWRQEAEQHYAQVEALFSLYSLLKPRAPLPLMRRWAISPDFAKLILSLIQNQAPAQVVELGAGVSTLISGYALEQCGHGGQVTALDHHPTFAEQARRHLQEHGLQAVARVLDAPLRWQKVEDKPYRWYSLSPELPAQIDLLIVRRAASAGREQCSGALPGGAAPLGSPGQGGAHPAG
ncbi:MAG: hypothetical protein HC915_08325 [Anaerolineae bacterium]|nr:hypothetical protein [Anaerolineae bacterium]